MVSARRAFYWPLFLLFTSTAARATVALYFPERVALTLYTVYIAQSKTTLMGYVGFTSKRLEDRAQGHLATARNRQGKVFQQAIRELGKDDFQFQTIVEVETSEFALELEKFFIKELGTLYPAGYNLTKGGHSSPNLPRPKQSEAIKAAWLRPDTRARLSGPRKKHDDAAKENHRAAALRQHADPDKKQRHLAAIQAAAHKYRLAVAGTRWITDGVISKRLRPGNDLPAGFRLGRK